MSAFCECDHHQLSHFVPFTLFIVFIDRRSLFSEPKQRNDHCLSPHLLANRETSSAFDSHSFLFFFDPLAVSLNIDMKIIRLVKFLGFHPISTENLELLTELQCDESWETFHSNSIFSRSILSTFLYSFELLNHVNLSSHAIFDEGSRVSSQETSQNLKIRGPLCAEN